MARKSRTAPSTTSTQRPKRARLPIPEPFRVISSATVATGDTKIKVPMLVLYGEWLKAVGFPIGSVACVITDERGELGLHREGLRVPRRLTIRATPR